MPIEKEYQGTRRPYGWGALYDLFSDRFPTYRTVQHVFDMMTFARTLGVAGETVYRAVRTNKLSPNLARRIIDLSKADGNHKITRIEMLDFVLPGED